MLNNLTSICILTVCVTLTLIAQLACHKSPLGNEDAQTAQAVNANANQNATTSRPSGEVAASRPPEPTGADAMRPGPVSREAVEKDREYYRRLARDQGDTIGKGPDDTWLWVRISYLLRSIPDSRIKMDINNGAVTLSGTVTNQEHVKRAESLVSELEGVKSVRNLLTVTPRE